MIENFLYKFKKIIRECNYDNTYKMALAKSLVEISLIEFSDALVEITMDDLASYFLKYYWNQTIFFDLVQGSNLKKIPLILQYTKDLIDKYHKHIGNNKPIRYERIDEYLEDNLEEDLNNTLSKIAWAIAKDVAWRFTYLDGSYNNDIYIFDKKRKVIVIDNDNLLLLKENMDDLFDLIDYRWGLILETFNSSPRINKKVKIIDGQDISRSSLTRFRKILDIENPDRVCFICGKKIEEDDLSIDHVIPWSYLYSDDIWNLVYVHKECNSSKSSKVPSELEINKLEKRNLNLQEKLHNKGISGKMCDELDIAIEHNYVKKFWIACK